MDAAVNSTGAVVRKSNAWKWVVGVLIVVVVAFLMLGRSVSNGYEVAVKQQFRAPGSQISFNGVKRYKSGVVCGMVSNHPAGWQRFVVDSSGKAALDDGAGPASQAYFNAMSDQLCRD